MCLSGRKIECCWGEDRKKNPIILGFVEKGINSFHRFRIIFENQIINDESRK